MATKITSTTDEGDKYGIMETSISSKRLKPSVNPTDSPKYEDIYTYAQPVIKIADRTMQWEQPKPELTYPGINYLAPIVMFGDKYPDPLDPVKDNENEGIFPVHARIKNRQAMLPEGITPKNEIQKILSVYHNNAACGVKFEDLVRVLNRGLEYPEEDRTEDTPRLYTVKNAMEQAYDCAALRKHTQSDPEIIKKSTKVQKKIHDEIVAWISNIYNVIQQLGSAAVGARFKLEDPINHVMLLNAAYDTIRITPAGIWTLRSKDPNNIQINKTSIHTTTSPKEDVQINETSMYTSPNTEASNNGGRRQRKTRKHTKKSHKTRRQLKKW